LGLDSGGDRGQVLSKLLCGAAGTYCQQIFLLGFIEHTDIFAADVQCRAKRIGKVIPYKRSQLRSIEIMEKICENMKDYGMLAQFLRKAEFTNTCWV
jgi:hypothetical protein